MSTEPLSWAEQARTALALTTVATLLTRSCRSEPTMTVVRVVDQEDGRPLVRLDPESPTARLLGASPVAMIAAPGPTPDWSLHLTGRFERVRTPGARGTFRPALHSVRLVGPAAIPIPVPEFQRAVPHLPAIPLDCRCGPVAHARR